MSKTNLTRRSFVKVSALAGAAAAVGASMAGCMQEAAPEEELAGAGEAGVSSTEGLTKMRTSCHGCIQMCPAIAYLKDGVVVRLEGDPEAPVSRGSLCIKGLNQLHTMYSPRRILHPLRRAGERGENKWEVISWDEAIAEICAKYQEYAEKDGPGSNVLHVGSGNFGSVALKSIEQLKAVLGMGSSNMSADLETSFAMGNTLGYGGFGTQNEQADWPNAKVFVCWMSDPCNSTPQSMHFILDAKEAGAKYVVIDPVFNANAGKADWFLGVNPSTDGALAFGALNYLLEQGWQDEEFIRARTEAPLFVKADGALLRMSDLGVEPTTSDQIDPMTGPSSPRSWCGTRPPTPRLPWARRESRRLPAARR